MRFIEAALLSEQKNIQFALVRNEEKVTFIINNSCSENTPPIYKIFEDGFSTKGENRGIGLKNVRTIIKERYKNVLLNTKIENLLFKQELVIQNIKKYN